MEGILDDDLSQTKQFTKEELQEVRKQRNVVVKLVNQVVAVRLLFVFMLGETVMNFPVNYYMNLWMEEELPVFSYSYAILFFIAAFYLLTYKKNTKRALLVGLAAYIAVLAYSFFSTDWNNFFALSTRVICIIGIVYNLRAIDLLPKAIQTLEDLDVPKYWVQNAKDLKEIPPTNSLLQINE